MDSSRASILITISAITFAATVVEIVYSIRKKRGLYSKGDSATNVYLASLAGLVNFVSKTATFFLLELTYQFHFFQIQHVVAYWLILFLGQDFLYYLLHRLGHSSRFFWAMHVTHHSSEHFNLTVGFRSTVFEPLYRVFFYMPLSLAGFETLDILYMYLLTQTWGILVHTQTIGRLHPLIEFLFVTPSHHRVHHGSNVRYLDRNLGMVLIIWDRLFGTFVEEAEHDPVRFGLMRPLESRGPVNIVFHEWKALLRDMGQKCSLLDKLRYAIYPPGWRHDGNSTTSRLLQAELESEENAGFEGEVERS